MRKRQVGVIVVCLGAVILYSCGPGERTNPDSTDTAPLQPSVVLTGLDVLERDGDPLFESQRIGLVVHGASMTRTGRHAIDVFLGHDYDVRRLFSPEHGLRGTAAAGETVVDGVDAYSGLEVVSLYGARTSPSAEQLADLDVLVVDLQGAGVRFYTYASTMLLSVQAALDAGLDVVVLDRPNPLGGQHVSGPVRDPSVALSLVSRAPGTLVSGLTVGEMAMHSFQEARSYSVLSAGRLYVIPLEGWRRSQTWADTGLNWRNPSPNLRSPSAALLYPATAMLEATNVSEGRGTEAPFLMIGAPWFDPALRADLIQLFAEFNVVAVATEFKPLASAAAAAPKFLGEQCHGLRLEPGPGSIDQYALGLTLLSRLARHPEFELRRGGEALTWLLGTPVARDQLVGGEPLDQHLAVVAADAKTWRSRRLGALLYE